MTKDISEKHHIKVPSYSAKVSIAPTFSAKGEYQSGVKIELACDGVSSEKEVRDFLTKAGNDIVKQTIEKVKALKILRPA
jgi:hypothetical protein